MTDKRTDAVVASTEKYETIEGVLFRRFFDVPANKVQLRRAIPQAITVTFKLLFVCQKLLN